MDVTTLVGIVLGAVLILISIMLGENGLDVNALASFFDAPSIMIVVGGTLAAVIASYPLSKLLSTLKHFKKLISGKAYQVEPVIEQLVDFATIARKNGLLALEEQANALTDPFFKQGIMYVVDATEAEKVRELMESDLSYMDQRHDEEAGIYEKAAAFAPSFGMIGTLIGLINMLAGMDLAAGSSSSIGADMSVALITTLYGCILGSLIFQPVAKKLRIRNEEELLYKQLIIEGVIGIQSGENPKALRERLASQLHQNKRSKIIDGAAGGGKGDEK